MSLDKVYEGTITLGVATNTYDAEGEVMTTISVPELTMDEVSKTLGSFMGDQYQTPPMFSAVKIDGQPLYKLARKGVEVEREPRFIRISKFEATRFESPEIDFTLNCTKGTYVRTLASDIGEKLDCGAHLSSLRRTASDRFHIKDSITLEAFREADRETISKVLIAKNDALPDVIL